MRIPFVDLGTQHQSIAEEINESIRNVIQKSDFILGEEVELFEAEFSQLCNAQYGVGVGSGTEALHLALLACDIGEGDEVIMPANTFVATILAVTYTGAKPVLVDVNPLTFNISIAQVREKITDKTRAIIPVHLYGLPVDLDELMQIAGEFDLRIIEDACQAHGAQYKGNRVGSIGDAGCYSFYPGKNLGAYGDGGMVVTNNNQIAEKVVKLRNYGQKVKYHHVVKGFNSRLDTIQAAVLRVKLKRLEEWNELRTENASQYDRLLSSAAVSNPERFADRTHVYHLYVIRTEDRDDLKSSLMDNGISCGIHYPVPLHLQDAFQDMGYERGDFPVAEELAEQILSLPMYPELTLEQIEYVAEHVMKFHCSYKLRLVAIG